MDIPDVHYARAGGVAIAYQVVGEGPQTLVFSPQVSDLFTIWLSQPYALLPRASRGTSACSSCSILEGPVSPTALATSRSRREWTTSLSVLDHVGVSRASLMGISTSANVCALFAASYPERVERLILAHPFPRAYSSENYPWGRDEEGWLACIRENRERWGDRDFMEEFARDSPARYRRGPGGARPGSSGKVGSHSVRRRRPIGLGLASRRTSSTS